MGWKTVIIGAECRVSLTLDRMRITINDEYYNIPLNDINTVIFTHQQAVFTTSLIAALIENNISIIVCNNKNDPIGIFQSFNGHSLVFKQLNNQLNWKVTKKKKLWKLIIEQKIQSEIDCLCFVQPDYQAIELLKRYKNEVLNNDDSNREATSAKVYFMALFGKSYSRDEDNAVNAALNYGYKIIASHISRCLAARGLITQIGIHHIGESNPFNLTYDFIEPFRYVVDMFVHENVNDKFSVKQKRLLIDLLQAKVYINNKWMRLVDVIEDILDSYIGFLNDTNDEILKIKYCQGIKYNGED